jgi:hypothetical protein
MRRRSSSNQKRWHLLARQERHASRRWLAAVPASMRLACLLVGLVGLGLAGSVALFMGTPAIAVALATVALGFVVIASVAQARQRQRPGSARRPGIAIVADTVGLSRISGDGKGKGDEKENARPIAHWDSPFGLTLLASYGRPQALLAFTTPTQTRYVPIRIDGRSDAEDELFARIAVLADLDLLDGVAHDAALEPTDAADLVRHADERARAMGGSGGGAIGRIFLSDSKGSPIALDCATLSVGPRSFDLTSHLEWRALMFHESTGQTAALYQATWIRQNGAEVVLVAPMPATIIPREPHAHREASGRLGRALTRDLRLLQTPAEPPPLRETRVAIDRPFMVAVRRILDEAPLAVRVAPSVPKARSEERDSIS